MKNTLPPVIGDELDATVKESLAIRQIINSRMARNRKLPRDALTVMAYLLNHMNLQTHVCLCSYTDIAQATSCSTRIVAKMAALLVQEGFLTEIQSGHLYKIVIPKA